jgi:hypothetical protein
VKKKLEELRKKRYTYIEEKLELRNNFEEMLENLQKTMNRYYFVKKEIDKLDMQIFEMDYSFFVEEFPEFLDDEEEDDFDEE